VKDVESELHGLLSKGKLAEAAKKVDEVIELMPKRLDLYQLKADLVARTGDREAMAKAYAQALEAFADSEQSLNELAWKIVTAPFEFRDVGAALQAATRATELTHRKNGAILDTLARAYYTIGLLDKAVEIQKEALAHSESEEKAEIQKVLDYYLKAVELQKQYKD
jgi:tetratricopeptide (TPR) repeat protein